MIYTFALVMASSPFRNLAIPVGPGDPTGVIDALSVIKPLSPLVTNFSTSGSKAINLSTSRNLGHPMPVSLQAFAL